MLDTSTLTIAKIRAHLNDKVHDALAGAGAPDARVELAPAPKPEMGDVGFPVFALAKVLRKAPPLIAKDVAARIEPDAVIAEVNTEKAYVNLRLDQGTFCEVVLREAIERGERFGGDQVLGETRMRWMVEYSSPNTNKPLHLGHLRNNLLGASVAKIAAFYGHEVTRVNLVNDRGVHICKSMLAYELWGEGTDPKKAGKKGDQLVGDFYVLFDQKLGDEYAAWKATPKAEGAAEAEDKDAYFNNVSELGAKVREMLRAWEAGDEAVVALWSKMNQWVFDGFDQSYARMGVGFERVQRESETYKLGKAIVEEGLEKGALKKRDDGATVCDLEQVGLQGEKVLLRSDGTSVYMTQDLGTAEQRFAEHELDKLVYVVGDEQIYHFDVLFKILGLLRPGLSERCYHLAYGMIRLPEGKMKSREGTVVDADDLMDAMHELAAEELKVRAADGHAHVEGIDEAEVSRRAEAIGMASLKYFLLKYAPKTSFEYDPKASIEFTGQTGPYALYNYGRTRSLRRKAEAAGDDLSFDVAAVRQLGTPQELALTRKLSDWPEVVARAAENYDPSRIAEYVFELCKAFAFIFTDKENHPIATCEDAALRRGRLLLADAVGNTIAVALSLLGIDVLEEM
ncbi:MAG: arginine--tRNA ligase [Proteobacteria bacterium]|nr:MAG: arginine--tRNA ligase [Pseudomonadota bacterium]